jgi:hypothetical protein
MEMSINLKLSRSIVVVVVGLQLRVLLMLLRLVFQLTTTWSFIGATPNWAASAGAVSIVLFCPSARWSIQAKL